MNDANPHPIDDASPERTERFVALYSEYYPRLQYFLMALLPTSSDAAEVLQETSLVLWKKFDTFEVGTNFYAWACRIARYQAMKHYENKNRGAQLFDTHTLELLAADAMEDNDRQQVPIDELETCLEQLPESDRNLIRRRYEPGASVNRIAAEIGLSANMLSKSLGRIRRLLLNCVERKLAQA